MRRRASILTLLSAAIAWGFFPEQALSAPPTNNSKPADLIWLVGEMEKTVFGAARKTLPLAQRIQNLEVQAMSQPRTGTLKSRVDKLMQVIGVNHQDSLPPPAPQPGASAAQAPPVAPSILIHNAATRSAPSFQSNRHAPSSSDDLRKLLLDAIKLHQEGRLVEAEDKFKEVLRADPANADAYYSLGSLSEARGDLPAALSYYSSAASINSGDREAREAVVQVQERMAREQGPFVNPLAVGSSGRVPVLQARAAEFTSADLPDSGMLFSQTPVPAQAISPRPYPGRAVSQSPMPVVNIANPPAQRPSSGTGRAVARGLARVAVGAALQYSGLHCPMCNILRGF